MRPNRLRLNSRPTIALRTLFVAGPAMLGLQGAGCSDNFGTCATTKTCAPVESQDASTPNARPISPAAGGSSGEATGGAGGNAIFAGGGSNSGGDAQQGRGTSGNGGANGSSGANGNGGADAQVANDGGLDSDSSPRCDETKAPSAEPCLLEDQYAVFVAPGHAGDGSKAAPAETLAQGLAMAKSRGRSRVIVCNATYSETLSLNAGSPQLQIFGGFHCPAADGGAAWAYEAGKRPLLAPKGGVPALNIDGASASLLIEDVDFTSANGTAVNPSSIAAIVHMAKDVTLRRVDITAGTGADGANGINGVKGIDGKPPGSAQWGTPAGAECVAEVATEPGGVSDPTSGCGSHGGSGGIARNVNGGSGRDGTSGLPTANTTNPGNVNNGAAASTAGGDGADGTPGSDGLDGPLPLAAASAGTFTPVTFVPAAGFNGTDGFSGQGGGGGGGGGYIDKHLTCTAATGGAGGVGGCGGTAGTRGIGGGASVALLVSSSVIGLESAVLRAQTAGQGGNGGHGGDHGVGGGGGGGGAPFSQDLDSGGGNGGKGGNGGHGASGSGGTGGPSYAIVSMSASTISQQTVTLIHGIGGAKGTGGTVGTTGLNPAPDGFPGTSGDALVLQ